MKVLVACEFSGIVREAFRKRGHDAWSCDLLPTEIPGNHIQGDVLAILKDGWDLMIAHPPCTYLSVSGLHWNKRIEGRQAKTEAALEFVRKLLDAEIPKICLENPVSCISTRIKKPAQIINPWMFGHDESKQTCLWLKHLPMLSATLTVVRPAWIPCPNDCGDFWCQRHSLHTADCECPPLEEWIEQDDDPYEIRYSNQTPSGQNKLGPSPTRAMDRSRTYQGIADAMAEQWG